MDNDPLRIEMFGGLRVRIGDKVIDRFRTRKVASLLACLALSPAQPRSRDELIGLLWPDMDEETGRVNLRQALCSLRHLLEDHGNASPSILIAGNSTICLSSAVVSIDVNEFEAAIRTTALEPERAIEIRARAIDLYRGNLLNGFYDEWIFPERRRLESLYLVALHDQIAALSKVGEPTRAIPFALRAIQADSCNEEAHLAAMRLYAAAGDPASVRRQWDEMRRTLKEELGEEPSEESQQIADTLIDEARVNEQRVQIIRASKASGGELSSALEVRPRPVWRRAAAAFAACAFLLFLGIGPVLRTEGLHASGPSAASVVDQRLAEMRALRTHGFATNNASETEAARRRHAQLCLDLAEKAWGCWYGRNEELWLKRFTESHEDLRTALRWLLDHNPEQSVQLSGALTRFWYVRGFPVEGYHWLNESISRAPAAHTTARARALIGCAFLSPREDERDESQYREALAIYRERGDRWGEAHALRHLGYLACSRAHYRSAAQYYRQALDLFTGLNDDRGRAVTLLCLSFVSDPTEGVGSDVASGAARESLDLYRKLDNPWGVSMALHSLGLLEKNPQRSNALIQQAIAAYPEANGLSGKELEERAVMAAQDGQFAKARRYYVEGLRSARDQGNKNAVAYFLAAIAGLPTSDSYRAARLYGAKLSLDRRLGIADGHRCEVAREQFVRRLGTRRFESALREGKRLTWEQAADEAATLN